MVCSYPSLTVVLVARGAANESKHAEILLLLTLIMLRGRIWQPRSQSSEHLYFPVGVVLRLFVCVPLDVLYAGLYMHVSAVEGKHVTPKYTEYLPSSWLK